MIEIELKKEFLGLHGNKKCNPKNSANLTLRHAQDDRQPAVNLQGF